MADPEKKEKKKRINKLRNQSGDFIHFKRLLNLIIHIYIN